MASAADPVASAAVSGVVVRGVATFDFVPSAANGRLDYAAITAKPIRGATIELIGIDGSVLASGKTTETGSYSLAVPANAQMQLRVRTQLLRSDAVQWDFTVRDNTASEAIYAIASSTFSSGSAAALQRDINAPSGWNGTGYSATRAAGPFALLDTVYTNAMKVVAVAPTARFPALRVFWSPSNIGASGDRTLGQIGTTSFLDSGNGTRSIYVLGMADIDTDEYDASVVSHEWGHYYQSAFSRDDSPGGAHGEVDLLDRRLAFSEGWGNAWSGIALARSTYTDAVGAGQQIGYSLDLTTGPQSNRGWFRETSIQAIFWNLERIAGFGPIHAAMTGALKSGLPMTSIHPFAAAYAVATPSQAGSLASLLQGQSISTSTADPWGDSETNNGGVALALPLYQQTNRQACVTSQAGQGNKLGRFAYVRFTLANSGNHRITVTGPASADPDFEVYQAGRTAGSYGGAAGTENSLLALPAGESVLVIYDANATASCFTVSIN
ncbi:hypothetical protein ACSFA3_18320 [Variovorax sp. RHLX14]|uniref:hypothetical protein n=1 Tax=Variovorax sp. RHLX14 TaxID=1259731 RepID=UPI003F473B2C